MIEKIRSGLIIFVATALLLALAAHGFTSTDYLDALAVTGTIVVIVILLGLAFRGLWLGSPLARLIGLVQAALGIIYVVVVAASFWYLSHHYK
jgi:hypothetical protein